MRFLVCASCLTSAARRAHACRYLKESQRWKGWTLEEELTRIPHDLWNFYVHASADHALLTPAVITGFTYFFADWVRANPPCMRPLFTRCISGWVGAACGEEAR